MSFFDETVNAMLRGVVVRSTLAVSFDFMSGTHRVWPGHGPLLAGGFEWSGIGELASISDFEMGPGLPTNSVTMSLSGLPAAGIADLLPSQQDECHGRPARIWMIFFDEALKVMDRPYCLRTLIMDRLDLDVDNQTKIAQVILTGEPLLATKHMPPFGYLTPNDQNQRHPADTGLERTPLYGGAQTVVWG